MPGGGSIRVIIAAPQEPEERVRLRSPRPEVRLVNAFARPYDNAVATARTCYSSKGIVSAEAVGGDRLAEPRRGRARARRDALARSIYEAGHHTTFQHAHFQFALSNVSRQFLWSFLHSHPFYNSEQVSQRYVEVGEGSVLVPELGGKAQAIYEGTVAAQGEAYRRLNAALHPAVQEAFFERFPGRRGAPERWEGEIRKKCQEIARYVLPVATLAYLYHTVSGITLLRYHRLCHQLDAPEETRAVVTAMVEAVLEHDSGYRAILEQPLELSETLEQECYERFHAGPDPADRSAFRHEFDASLGGEVSRLVDWKARNEETLAASVREVLGIGRDRLSDEEAIEAALDASRNRYLGEALNLTTLSKLSRVLAHPAWTFRKRISHTADSQDQRHRMTPASRPLLTAHLDADPDVVTPVLVPHAGAEVEALYRDSMERSWAGIRALRAAGADEATAAYLLPNAVALRFTESADLLALHHKLAMRLCYLAQEEIWQASLAEARQVAEVNPRIGRHLLPPCTQRFNAGLKPYCPEGKRYCGVRVWTLPLDAYSRII